MSNAQAAEVSAPTNRTLEPNPQTQTNFFKFMKVVFAVLQILSSRLAAKLLFKMWFKTKHRDLRPPEEVVMKKAQLKDVYYRHWRIKTYVWPGSGPTVMVAHGWGSVSGSMYAIIEALLEEGYQVVAMDGPGHGASSENQASLFDYAEVLAGVGKTFGPLRAAIGHSAGGLCLTLALNKGLEADYAVTIGAPNRVVQLVDNMCEAIGFSDKTTQHFKRLFELRFGDDVWTRGSAENNVKKSKVPALIVHDQDDNEITYDCGLGIHQAWSNSELLTTEGLGHKKLLADEKVVTRVVSFIGDAIYQ